MSKSENLTPAHLRCSVGMSCPSIHRLEDVSEPENLTPAHLRCAMTASCPSIHRTEDGSKLIIVGTRASSVMLTELGIPLDYNTEEAVIIALELLDSLKAEWVREAAEALARSEADWRKLNELQRPLFDTLKDTVKTIEIIAAERDALKAAIKPEISSATRVILEEAAEADEAVNDGVVGRAITTLLQWYDQTRAALVKP